MRSHFVSGAAVACAVAGASTLMMDGNCSAGAFIAADYATNSTYLSGWAAGQNGGYGFGAWSFDGTTSTMTNNVYTNGIPDPGDQQAISSGSAIGTAWTLFNSTAKSPPAGPGISDVGRAITEPGGLQPGQTLEVVLQNPSVFHYFRGWDILCLNGTDNYPAGEPADPSVSAIRTQLFDSAFYNPGTNWSISDGYGSLPTTLYSGTTAAAGMKYDLTLTSTNTYVITLTPLSNPSAAYSQSGPLTTNLPINYVNVRLYFGPTTGPNDPADNLEISSMTIAGLTLNIQVVGTNAVLSWTTNVPGFLLASTANLASPIWSTNNLPPPVIVNGQNVVTNPIVGTKQYFRLQQ
jgi:hypothetical protein